MGKASSVPATDMQCRQSVTQVGWEPHENVWGEGDSVVIGLVRFQPIASRTAAVLGGAKIELG